MSLKNRMSLKSGFHDECYSKVGCKSNIAPKSSFTQKSNAIKNELQTESNSVIYDLQIKCHSKVEFKSNITQKSNAKKSSFTPSLDVIKNAF